MFEALLQTESGINPEPQGVLHQYLVMVCKARFDYAGALFHARQAVQCLPHSYKAWGNLANLQRDLQDFYPADASYRKALLLCHRAQDPVAQAQLRFNLALLQLTRGDDVQGSLGFLAKAQGGLERPAPEALACLPRWQGESLRGKRVLIQALEGFGDCLQWLRFVPQFKAFTGAAAVGFCPHPELVTLLFSAEEQRAGYAPLDSFCMFVDPELALRSEAYEVWLPLYALLHLCQARFDHLPAPWQRVFPARVPPVSSLNTQACPRTPLKIGLVWQANPLAPTARRRNVPVAQLSQWMHEMAGATATADQGRPLKFYGLQYQPLEPLPTGPNFEDLSESLTDFAVTAAYVQQMDVLVTVDTVMAHLGATLGVPVCLLLSYVADWRWLSRAHQQSPWYGQIYGQTYGHTLDTISAAGVAEAVPQTSRALFKLCRQSAPGQWSGALARVTQQLQQTKWYTPN